MVQGTEHWKYDERLEYVGLMWLDTSTARSDLIETFKIMNGKYDISHDLGRAYTDLRKDFDLAPSVGSG